MDRWGIRGVVNCGLQFKVTDASVSRRAALPLSVSQGPPIIRQSMLAPLRSTAYDYIVIVPTFRWCGQAKKRVWETRGAAVAFFAPGCRPAFSA
jgi:hypothetical protein